MSATQWPNTPRLQTQTGLKWPASPLAGRRGTLWRIGGWDRYRKRTSALRIYRQPSLNTDWQLKWALTIFAIGSSWDVHLKLRETAQVLRRHYDARSNWRRLIRSRIGSMEICSCAKAESMKPSYIYRRRRNLIHACWRRCAA